MIRRWKILLVLNAFAVAGFVTFWGKCNLRTSKATGQQAPIDARGQTRLNGSAQDASITHEVLLKRLGSLEDVVYRQLNEKCISHIGLYFTGLSKSLGLIEGFGGRGRGGVPATMTPAEEKQAKYLRAKYGYNAFLSDRISLDRSIPDYRPSKCRKVFYPRDLPQISLIFIFVNEALSVILRSVHSAVNHTPAYLLKEIILVDDSSDDEQLKGPLEEYVNKRYPGLIKIVRNQKREGLIRARIEGWKVATAEVTGFFDAHVEFTPAWAEPVLSRIKENPKRIILPSIDNIKDDTFELERYENSGHGFNWELWCMYISPPKQWWDRGDTSAPIRTPAMIGCSFVANRDYFGELGLLDSGMDVYGGENVELGIRVWMCGGSMEVLPCSRVAHIARTKKPYHSNIAFHTRRNALRVAEVWMDEYKSSVYLAWNIPMENHGIDYGDISERVALRNSLRCKDFEWYLNNIYPEMRRYNNTLFYGEIRNTNVTHLCVDQGVKENHTATLHPCHGWSPQVAPPPPELLWSEHVDSPNSQNESIMNRATGRCLEVVQASVYFGYTLVLRPCTGQRWNIRNTMQQRQGP
uniref:Polypeptide N-acetylgalactosaminyltransferase n=1 Tax=Electrophorus electricus TaxID=8005 RepID=A0AAY5EH98_ELEEL